MVDQLRFYILDLTMDWFHNVSCKLAALVFAKSKFQKLMQLLIDTTISQQIQMLCTCDFLVQVVLGGGTRATLLESLPLDWTLDRLPLSEVLVRAAGLGWSSDRKEMEDVRFGTSGGTRRSPAPPRYF